MKTRKAHRLINLKPGDYVDINPLTQHPGWRIGEISEFPVKRTAGQVRVTYEHQGRTYSYLSHMDITQEVGEFGTKCDFTQLQYTQSIVNDNMAMMSSKLNYSNSDNNSNDNSNVSTNVTSNVTSNTPAHSNYYNYNIGSHQVQVGDQIASGCSSQVKILNDNLDKGCQCLGQINNILKILSDDNFQKCEMVQLIKSCDGLKVAQNTLEVANAQLEHLKMQLDNARAQCEKMVKKSQEIMQQRVNKLEKGWRGWDVGCVLAWFQYIFKSNKRFNGNFSWDLIHTKLRQNQWNGQYLAICNERELANLGFVDKNDIVFLTQKIKELINDGDIDVGGIDQDTNNNKDKEKEKTQDQTKDKEKETDKDKDLDEEKEKETECRICYDGKINTICSPCGHACMCRNCGNNYMDDYNQCPICRKKIDAVFACFI